ncbi:5-beta-cholestane-3-alpha,7-alpha-diol 12-alpha-hydroxylase [Empidonax traillii]|uniref:5-beta-cholestane-3-alpha,7-alpha-diol 12-alpha-hydroxylase n=1 Tax=Empidonax traillii TaxID=164674 RepID=UPI000FFD9560|nr:5-beta-cholestane-3-alpha,7-alpha-diol 12-alpha-hydroxylase [Empidonax traillii]
MGTEVVICASAYQLLRGNRKHIPAPACPRSQLPDGHRALMGLWVALLCALVASLLGGLYVLGVFRRRRPDEPPLDKGSIPWLGYLLDFRKDSSGFLKRMQRKHGDVFTVLLGGRYFTFVMDPFCFGSIVKESRSKLDFRSVATELVLQVFGYKPTEDNHNIVRESSMKHLMGDGLSVLTQTTMENFQKLMLFNLRPGEERRAWQEENLFHYCYNIVFRAGYLALYGSEPHQGPGGKERAEEQDRVRSNHLFHEFRKYDRLFPRLAFSVLPPKDKKEAERLKRLFWSMLSVKNAWQKDNISGWISDQDKLLAENGVPEYMRDRFMFMLLWASQGNTGPTAFWLLLYLLKHPEALEAVRGEVDKVLRENGQEVKAGSRPVTITRDMLSQAPLLDSALEETLRLVAAPLLIRAVLEEISLKTGSGAEYTLRKGDRLALFPHLAVQMNPDIHDEPHKFKYDRFVNPDGTKRDFYKNGKKLKYVNMPWGAGVSTCPGRFFASAEMKLFVFLMLSHYDLELVNEQEEIPGIDISRWGFGTMQPVHDVRFRFRPRF